MERLNGIPNVSQALAVNEENDVNGMLHKAGGYTSAIFFTSDLVDTAANYIEDGDSIEKGTDGVDVSKSLKLKKMLKNVIHTCLLSMVVECYAVDHIKLLVL